VEYVGPILGYEAPVPRPAGARQENTVLISFSTTLQGQQAALPPVVEAIGRLPVRGLLSLGGALRAEDVHAPANVEVVDYVPHADVLPGTAAVVCHGGLTTVTTALAFGVPLVCIPQGREQPLNAERVEACGVGVSVPPDADPPAIAEAVRSVLDDPSYREAAQRMAAVIGAEGAGDLAARLVEELLRAERVPARS
jgi:MGT family glycosyltransferase